MTSSDNSLIIEGTFNSTSLAFDGTLNYTGADDVFAAKLNKSDLTVIKAQKSGIDEGDANKNEEVWMASAVSNNHLMQAIKTNVVNKENLNSFLMTSDLSNQLTATTTTQAAQKFITGLSANDNKVVMTTVTSATTPTITYEVSNVVFTGVNNKFVTDINVYPNPVSNVVKLSKTCDVTLLSITGTRIKQAKGVNSLDISELPSGIYYIIVSTEKGTDTFKVSKK